MRLVAAVGSLFTAVVLSACAINPLPQDVTGLTTPDIVRQVRCEARDAAIEALVNFLRDRGRAYPNRPGDAKALELAQRYRADPNAVAEFRPFMLTYATDQATVGLLYSVGIAYNFELTMTEENNISGGSINTQSGPSTSLLTIAIGGSVSRKRDNKRTFTITDTFDFLLKTMNQQVDAAGRRDCDQAIVRNNYIYPIAGRIGIRQIVYDFLDLAIFGNLGSKEKGPPSLSDTLTFTTALDASITPRVAFIPTGSSFQLTGAAITAGARRTDAHQVIVGIALPPGSTDNLDSLRSYFFASPIRTGRPAAADRASGRASLVIGERVIGGGTPSELVALAAVDQQKKAQIQFLPAP